MAVAVAFALPPAIRTAPWWRVSVATVSAKPMILTLHAAHWSGRAGSSWGVVWVLGTQKNDKIVIRDKGSSLGRKIPHTTIIYIKIRVKCQRQSAARSFPNPKTQVVIVIAFIVWIIAVNKQWS